MTDSHRTDISFITICYNGFKDTCELIESLQEKLHSVTYEIIVVDNASREDEAAKISRLYPSVIAIRSEVNRGFSGGNNTESVRQEENTSSSLTTTPISSQTQSPAW